MLTEWAAYATFQEDQRGTIEIGKWADLTLLSQDIDGAGGRDPRR